MCIFRFFLVIFFHHTYLVVLYPANNFCVQCVPIDYCLHPLNKSDCNIAPAPVFSYYKAGSRCEIEIWRGCPTRNKFDNEYQCSHFCIGKLTGSVHSNFIDPDFNTTKEIGEPHQLEEEVIECLATLNKTECTTKVTKVFTYDPQSATCVKETWYGCETHNKFDDEDSCVKECVPGRPERLRWQKKISDLPLHEIKELEKVLDDVIYDNIEITEAPIHPISTERTVVGTTEGNYAVTTKKHGVASSLGTTHVTTTEEITTTAIHDTTEDVTETTEKATETTAKATETTAKATETTEKATETTTKATETTEKATETTVKATETTAKATEMTATPETTTTPAITTTLSKEPGEVTEVITT